MNLTCIEHGKQDDEAVFVARIVKVEIGIVTLVEMQHEALEAVNHVSITEMGPVTVHGEPILKEIFNKNIEHDDDEDIASLRMVSPI